MSKYTRTALLAEAIASMKEAQEVSGIANGDYYIRESMGWLEIADRLKDGDEIDES